MKKEMKQVSVTAKDGMVWIGQECYPEDSSSIELAPDQIDVLIEWLKAAQASVTKEAPSLK